MTPEEQRIAIAESDGFINAGPGHPVFWYRPLYPHWFQSASSRPYFELYELPDYLNDLNAMHEVEKSIGFKIAAYAKRLEEMTQGEGWHATASQRAEAYLRTIGKWKD